MTNLQLTAKTVLARHKQFLTKQQIKTINGQIKAGDITGAMNGLHTIVGKNFLYYGRRKENWSTQNRNRQTAV